MVAEDSLSPLKKNSSEARKPTDHDKLVSVSGSLAGEGHQRLASLQRLTDQVAASSAVQAAAAALSSGSGSGLDGVWGSACTLVAAALDRLAPSAVLVVSPHFDDLRELGDELAMFADRPVWTLPGWDVPPEKTEALDPTFAERLAVVKEVSRCFARHGQRTFSPKDRQSEQHHHNRPLIAASIQTLMQPVPDAQALKQATLLLRVGDTINPQELLEWLVEHGLRGMPAVELPGEFSQRGGILDLFPPDYREPVRIELFGDTIESIRHFDVGTQRSLASLDQFDLTILPEGFTCGSSLVDHLPEDTWVVLIDPVELDDQGRRWIGKLKRRRGLLTVQSTLERLLKRPTATISQLPGAAVERTATLATESVERYQGGSAQLGSILEDQLGTDPRQVAWIVCATQTEVQRIEGELGSLVKRDHLELAQGRLRCGFRLREPPAVVLSGSELLGRREAPQPRGRRQMGRTIDSFLELKEGDYVVHVTHGIGQYCGLTMLQRGHHREEHLEIEFAGGTRLYVPTAKIDLVQKYVGGRKQAPKLSKVGGRMWSRRKEQAQQAVEDLASEMLSLQAERQSLQGIAFGPDSEWQQQFELAFPYQETPDQATAIAAIKGDMQSVRPMDRLICGEVGFGKTELAMRAAFKAVDHGYQVAVLVPTTVLAEQHFRTFSERMRGFPFQIGCLSRFRSKSEQKELLSRLSTGSLDIVIGTHRLIQPDVHFANLGLLVIDEEQRFGVEAKETLKIIRRMVDVVALTATPIPRTLHLSLLGVRDISSLETPPANRLAVETRVTTWSPELIEYAIRRELGRGGQIFFVHNRIHSLNRVADQLRKLVPEARIGLGHGQMAEDQLSRVMLDFVEHRTDILLATTIVESGLDIPRANTMFIDDADRYGLAELHQLRGRVGRYKHRAYCYMLVDPKRPLTGDAARRLKAIEEFTSIGAGFSIAMRDLEIRGAGNILGTEQSGHIAAVGYELYTQLLEKTVRRLQDLPPRERVEVNIDLPGEAYLPKTYVSDMRMKIDLYRRLSRVTQQEDLQGLLDEMADRFGRPPEVVARLVRLARLRIWAHQWGISSIHLEDAFAVLKYQDRNLVAQLVLASRGRLRVVDDLSAYFPLEPDQLEEDGVVLAMEDLLRPPTSTYPPESPTRPARPSSPNHAGGPQK